MRPYRASEAAAIIGITRTWLVAQARAGQLQEAGAFRTQPHSGHWRFEREAFDRHVANLRAGIKTKAKRERLRQKDSREEYRAWLAGLKE